MDTNNLQAQHTVLLSWSMGGGIGSAGLVGVVLAGVLSTHRCVTRQSHCCTAQPSTDGWENSFSYIAFLSCVTSCCYACNCGLVIIPGASSSSLFTVLHWPGVWTQVLHAVLGRLPDHQNHRGRDGPGIYQHRPNV